MPPNEMALYPKAQLVDIVFSSSYYTHAYVGYCGTQNYNQKWQGHSKRIWYWMVQFVLISHNCWKQIKFQFSCLMIVLVASCNTNIIYFMWINGSQYPDWWAIAPPLPPEVLGLMHLFTFFAKVYSWAKHEIYCYDRVD